MLPCNQEPQRFSVAIICGLPVWPRRTDAAMKHQAHPSCRFRFSIFIHNRIFFKDTVLPYGPLNYASSYIFSKYVLAVTAFSGTVFSSVAWMQGFSFLRYSMMAL